LVFLKNSLQQDKDPLEFWKENEAVYPLLSKFAKKFLGSPATSLASESMFSTARDIFSYRRMRIRARKAEMILFLNRTLPLINYRY